MKRKTKILFQHAIGRRFRREMGELDAHPQERRVHNEIRDPDAPAPLSRNTRIMLVNRAQNIWRIPLARPRRSGKTARDRRNRVAA